MYSKRNLHQSHFIYQKSHTEWSGIERGPLHLEAGE